ncbi:RNA recognition motif domain-containing protein [Haloferula sargassicola]|uniref:RRM domain-containing protein n=1 Tax=Haloferula sargassicola TaxID=490096 RepID=A0ABP9URY5_9BACT
MSNTTSDARGNGEKRRRSRGGRNRNRNRNRQNQGDSPNHNPNRGEGGGGQRRRRSGAGGQAGGGGTRSRTRAPKPKPLTWWQKLLKAIGLYKEPEPKRRGDRKEPQPVKSNTRIAKTREPREPREKDSPEKRRERAEAKAKDVDSRRLYLGNLSYEATESDLEELFRGVGSVRRVEIVYNRRTHRSKGYGFIEMLDTDEAKKSVEVLHDQFFMGRKLVVSAAKSDGPADTDDREQESDEETPAAESKQAPAAAPIEHAPAAEAPAQPQTEAPAAAELPEEEKPQS